MGNDVGTAAGGKRSMRHFALIPFFSIKGHNRAFSRSTTLSLHADRARFFALFRAALNRL